MTTWRDAILKNFVPNVSKLTLVADPDGLMTEERLVLALRDRGFELIEFLDAIEFRYVYEQTYRSLWDQGLDTDLVVILRLPDTDLESLPYDLLKAGRKLSFNLGQLFPNMAYPVIERLDRNLLDKLFSAQTDFPPERMADKATMDYVLRHVYAIAAELIVTEVELMRVLLRLHYAQTRLPEMLSERLVSLLSREHRFVSWPLRDIIPDGSTFMDFLQERWPLFLHRREGIDLAAEQASGYALRYPGPEDLPFDHEDIRVFIDNLFVEGRLAPLQISSDRLEKVTCSWSRCGLATGDVNGAERIARLLEKVEQTVPVATARYVDWIAFAWKWSELAALIHSQSSSEPVSSCSQSPNPSGEADFTSHFNTLRDRVNETFFGWLQEQYPSLISLPPSSLAMLHQLPRMLASTLESSSDGFASGGTEPPMQRMAMVVMDGLSMDQWLTLRRILQSQDARLAMQETATFAWIPTLTSVSRQAVFAGRAPLYFPHSINSTQSEEKLWKQFWETRGITHLDVAFLRGLGDGDPAAILDASVNLTMIKVLGLVVDKVDRIMHGMQLGAAGMHNQIAQWGQGGFLLALINHLLDHGYAVWLTSDHGNIECVGTGRPAEGLIAEIRGERVRVYASESLRDQVSQKHPLARPWNPVGLPPAYFPLLANGQTAFAKTDGVLVGHGGAAIEEVIVPLVAFSRRTR